MPGNDFDIDGLARFLHLPAAKVKKLANQGDLPGRRVGGEWRFSEAEIHHWLEERIGATEQESELARVENVLTGGDENVSITNLLPQSAVRVGLPARSRRSVIDQMTELAAATGLVWDPQKVAQAVLSREQLHPTALDSGVALLHPRRPLASVLAEPLLALGVTVQGIPFGGRRGEMTDVFFLICSTDDRGHLRCLARLSRLLASPEFLPALRDCATDDEAWSCVERHEAELEDE